MLPTNDTFWFVTVISNPCHALASDTYRKFRCHIVNGLKANLLTVLCSFVSSPPGSIDEDSDTNDDDVCTNLHVHGNMTIDVRVQTRSWLMIKENLLNVGVSFLPTSWEYVAFCDPDIRFLNSQPNTIISSIINALQSHEFVQPFDTVYVPGRKSWQSGEEIHLKNTCMYGGALAMKKETFERFGGLFEIDVVGKGLDRMLAKSTIQHVEGTVLKGRSKRVASVPLEPIDAVLTKYHFDPSTDIGKNRLGVFEVTSACHPKVREVLQRYTLHEKLL